MLQKFLEEIEKSEFYVQNIQLKKKLKEILMRHLQPQACRLNQVEN